MRGRSRAVGAGGMEDEGRWAGKLGAGDCSLAAVAGGGSVSLHRLRAMVAGGMDELSLTLAGAVGGTGSPDTSAAAEDGAAARG